MALKITASNLLTNHYLNVQSDGVHYCEASFGSTRRFRFQDITCVLMSADSKLSFQVGQEVFSIPTKPEDEKQQTVIATLLSEIRRCHSST